ncbi:MAG TPA: hypothetical protein DCX95_07835 [Elusimicrobia bacterium]|nr:hypothetical protein [Elusimicrobiota bacterium]
MIKKLFIPAIILLSILCVFAISMFAISGTSFTIFSSNFNSAGSEITNVGNSKKIIYTLGNSIAYTKMQGNHHSLQGGLAASVFPVKAAAANLEESHAFPVPFRSDKHTKIIFTKLTSQAKIKIYTISGERVCDLQETDGDGMLSWDVKNSDGDDVASGVYIYYIENNNMHKSGKVVVIR